MLVDPWAQFDFDETKMLSKNLEYCFHTDKL